MVSLHQWKKYRVDFECTYKSNFHSSNSGKTLGESELDGWYYRDFEFDKKTGEYNLIGRIQGKDADFFGSNPDYLYDNDGNDKTVDVYKCGHDDIIYYREIKYTGYFYSTLDKKIPKQGSYVGLVQGGEGEYPQNGQKDGIWYVYDKALNKAPSISGSDLDLGAKTEDFDIEYFVSDPDGDEVKVSLAVDGTKKFTDKPTPLGIKQRFGIELDKYELGSHKVEIMAVDSKGARADTRTFFFNKTNSAPSISGKDEDLGNKSTAFTIAYRVEDRDSDSVRISVSLDDREMATIADGQGKDLLFTLDSEKIKELVIGKSYTITIKADDGKGGIAFRRYRFTKANTPPIISGVDTDLGKVKEPFTIKFSVSDVERDKISGDIMLDDKALLFIDDLNEDGSSDVVDGREYSYTIDHNTFIKLPYGKHELVIEVYENENQDNQSQRKYSFERVAGGLDVEVKLGEYDSQPRKIVAVPHGQFIDAKEFKVLACNNYLDDKPTWEDITNMSKIARAFSFTNSKKTAGKWALGVRVIIENGQADVSSVLRGIKGGIE